MRLRDIQREGDWYLGPGGRLWNFISGRWRQMKQIRTRIAGFNHHDGAAKALQTMRPQTRLLLVPEPDNPYDRNAIKIMTTSGQMLGYVPRVDNVGVWNRIGDKDVLVRCFKTSDTFNSIVIQYEAGDPLA